MLFERKIKFRGKTINGEWVYGNLTTLKKKVGKGGDVYFISNGNGGLPVEVLTETVGQFIGITDRKGKEIYEGDVLKQFNKSVHTKKEYWFPIYEVRWQTIEFSLKYLGGGKNCGSWYLPLTNWGEMEIIAN